MTELADETVRKDAILSNRDKAQRRPGQGLDGKGVQIDEYIDNPSNHRPSRDDGAPSPVATQAIAGATATDDVPVDRGGFDFGGSTGKTEAGKGLGLGTDAMENRKGWSLPDPAVAGMALRDSDASSMENTMTGLPERGIATRKVCFILSKARQFDAKEAVTDPDSGSNALDDGMVDVLEHDRSDPVAHELKSFIHDLDIDEQVDLVALAWLGRGDGTIADWSMLQSDARYAHNTRTAAYLMGLPLLSDYLEEGLSLFGETCEDFQAK